MANDSGQLARCDPADIHAVLGENAPAIRHEEDDLRRLRPERRRDTLERPRSPSATSRGTHARHQACVPALQPVRPSDPAENVWLGLDKSRSLPSDSSHDECRRSTARRSTRCGGGTRWSVWRAQRVRDRARLMTQPKGMSRTEPTSVLTQQAVDKAVLRARKLAAEGTSIR